TLAELSAFNAVMVWSNNQYLNAPTLGNNLADYVDRGGSVVMAMFDMSPPYNLTGRWESGQYYVIPRSTLRTGTASLGTISQPGHPIMSNVTTFSGGTSSYRPSSTALAAGATLIASWSDGVPLVAVKTISGRRRADLGFFPPSNTVDSRFWVGTTDGTKLMANALEWVAGGAADDWLSFDRTSGTVAPNTSVTINAKISTRNLRPDTTYNKNVLISSNDPANAVVTIPASLRTSPPCTGPTHFTFTANTGNSYALLIDEATLDGVRLRRCDEIGVFTPAGLCVGAVAWNDTLPLGFSAWEDNPQTPAVDGYRVGERMSFRFWHAQGMAEYQATPAYTIGNGNFGAGSLSRLSLSATSRVTQSINLRQGWNWISLNVEPSQPRLDSVFAGVSGLEIVQNNAGRFFIPNVINQIGNWNVLEGYFVYLNRNNTLTVRGRKVATPTPIPVSAGWNSIPYFPDSPLSPQIALQSIITNLDIVQDDSGHFMIPGLVDNIKQMRLGRGYRAHLKASGTLIYPGGSTQLAKASTSLPPGASAPTTHFQSPTMTGQSYSLVVTAVTINGVEANPGDEIALFTASGRCVGAGVWNESGMLALAAWQDDERTEAIDGCQSGEAIHFRLWIQQTNTEMILTPAFERGNGIFGHGDYAVVKLSAQTLPAKFALREAYPNPFNPETTIAYELPRDAYIIIKVFDVMGREVRTLVDEPKPAGYHQVVWDGRNAQGHMVASGIYLYKLKSSEFAQTKRVLFMK
ncbi:MAG: T9SS type A sorting domain-containing protein, partial [candidate division KSB1 bacterium]|nr:T9SS type A sorting domain-containing protein [candidate division KSB1 bacterium]